MTGQEYAELMEREHMMAKTVNLLKKKGYREFAEDWAARAINRHGLRKSRGIALPEAIPGMLVYVFDVAVSLAYKDTEKLIAQRRALYGLAKVTGRRHDPTRHIDYKVDLEKAIRLTTGHRIVQQALWHIHFEDWTWDEVLNEMPKDVPQGTWNNRIAKANRDLQRRLNAFGYRG